MANIGRPIETIETPAPVKTPTPTPVEEPVKVPA